MTASAAAGTAPAVFRVPRGEVFLSIFVIAMIGAVTLFLAAAAALFFTQSWPLGLFMTAIACFTGGLTGYVSRDLGGKWGLRIALGPDAATFHLPANRSLIHRPPAQHLTIPYADIAALETRLEAYRSFGMAMMQRAYVLRRKNGDLIFLFEDRALGTGIETSFFAAAAKALSARADIPWRDIGMVEGKGGVLGVWRTQSPDWAASSLSLARQLRLWRHAVITGSIAFVVALSGLLLRGLAALF